MVIAASLSQVQNLLQHDALLAKPQLLETFDRALTGCRIVYGCLEEEVRDLVVKAERDDLKFKDRAKFLWKEDTFKELLTQIRGQQSALSLLIQGLQMESIADIRKLVEDNSVTLDQVVKRSRTLRQSHPRVKVPDSILDRQHLKEDAADAESILKSAEFAFDDEVINSKAYRRAMAHYVRGQVKAPIVSAAELTEDDLTLNGPDPYNNDTSRDSARELSPINLDVIDNKPSPEVDTVAKENTSQITAGGEHEDLFDTLERDILSFMPRITSTAPYLSPDSDTQEATLKSQTGTWFPAPLRSYSEGYKGPNHEHLPPLPPRRPSGSHLPDDQSNANAVKTRSSSENDSIYTSEAPSILSKGSTASSQTAYEPSQSSLDLSHKPSRKPLPLGHKASHDVLARTWSASPDFGLSSPSLALRNSEMHDLWRSLIDAEQKYIDRMYKFRKMFYDNIIRQWPVLEKHLAAILLGEQLADLNKQYVLQDFTAQIAGDGATICDPSSFETWTNRVQRAFREYCQRVPHAVSSLRTTQNLDLKFGPFVNTLGLSIAYFGMGWEDYLKLPQVHLQVYIDTLQSLVNIAESLDEPEARQEARRLRRALKAVTWLRTLTSNQLDAAQAREDIQNLEKRIRTADHEILSQLKLLDPTRRVRHQGGMAMKWKSQGAWTSVHVVLLDNYLFWGKAKAQKKTKGDEFVVMDAVSVECLRQSTC